jgi:hypothetical protein
VQTALMQLMKPKATLRRATRLVRDNATITLWFVDATELGVIRCRKWHFQSVALAEAAEREIVDGVGSGVSTDILVRALTLLTDGEMTVCRSMTIVVEFFSGVNNVALQGEAHALLAALANG